MTDVRTPVGGIVSQVLASPGIVVEEQTPILVVQAGTVKSDRVHFKQG